MKSFKLDIAGYVICFKKEKEAPPFNPALKLKPYFNSRKAGVTITVFNRSLPDPLPETELLSAPYVEEQSDGSLLQKSEKLWSVYQAGNKRVIRIYDYKTGEILSDTLISLTDPEWQLYSVKKEICSNPFSWPLDGLILYYLTVINRDIIIHASAVEFNGKGYLFAGASGTGKSTMAELWKLYGAKVIDEDRVVVSKKKDGSVIVAGTPLYNNSYPKQTILNAIFILEHSRENSYALLKGTEALTSVMSNTVQHNYDSDMVNDHINKIMELVETIPVYRLGFVPDLNVVGFVEGIMTVKVEGVEGVEEVEGVIETVKAVLESGNSVELNATGFSMFPTLRPGDRVMVRPYNKGELPLPGSIVVYRDNNELVIHRLIGVQDISGEYPLFTRGDSREENDKSLDPKQLLGIAVSYIRGKKEYEIKNIVPAKGFYKYNQLALWIYFRMKKVVRNKSINKF